MQGSSAFLVLLAGLAVSGIGFLGVVAPAVLVRLLRRWRVVTRLPVTVALRIVFGSIFVTAAPDCRLPTLVRVLGLLEFGAAMLLLGVGARRLERFVDWWLERSAAFVRRWCLGALALGAILLYAAA